MKFPFDSQKSLRNGFLNLYKSGYLKRVTLRITSLITIMLPLALFISNFLQSLNYSHDTSKIQFPYILFDNDIDLLRYRYNEKSEQSTPIDILISVITNKIDTNLGIINADIVFEIDRINFLGRMLKKFGNDAEITVFVQSLIESDDIYDGTFIAEESARISELMDQINFRFPYSRPSSAFIKLSNITFITDVRSQFYPLDQQFLTLSLGVSGPWSNEDFDTEVEPRVDIVGHLSSKVSGWFAKHVLYIERKKYGESYQAFKILEPGEWEPIYNDQGKEIGVLGPILTGKKEKVTLYGNDRNISIEYKYQRNAKTIIFVILYCFLFLLFVAIFINFAFKIYKINRNDFSVVGAIGAVSLSITAVRSILKIPNSQEISLIDSLFLLTFAICACSLIELYLDEIE